MVSNATVGALRVSLGLDSAQFSSGLKNAQTGLQRFSGIAKTAGLAIGTAMVAAGGAMALAMQRVINEADEMYKLAQAIGVPVDDLSRLAYAADLSGVSVEDLGKAVKRLSASMYEASQNATGGAADAFKALGIEVEDTQGRMRSASSVIADLAGRFALMPNGVEKTALAMKIFGKSGADLIPLLNSGSDGLRDMYAEAERLGIVLDEETAKAAERFNDNLTRLGKTKDGIVTKITAGMLPSLERLSASMVGVARNGEGLKTVGRGLGIVMNSIIAVFFGVAGAIWAAGLNMAAFVKTMERVIHLDFAGAAEAWERGSGKAMTSLRGTVSQINALFTTVRGGDTALPALADGLNDTADSASRAARSVRHLTDEERASAQAAAELASSAERTFSETRTPMENYTARLKELREELQAGLIDQDTFNRAVRMAGVALDAANPLSQAGARIAEENRREAAEDTAADLQRLKEHREDLHDATYDGIRGGLEAAADGNLGQYLASRIRDALFNNLATTLTDLFRGARDGSTGSGLAGWASTAASLAKTFARGIPGFSKGVENFGGGLAYVHKGEVLANLPKGTSVIPAKDLQGGGGGSPVVFDLRGAVMTADLLRQMEGMAAKGAQVSVQASRQVVPADDARRRRFSL